MSPWNCPNQIVIWVVNESETRFMFLLPLTSGPVKAGPFFVQRTFFQLPVLATDILLD